MTDDVEETPEPLKQLHPVTTYTAIPMPQIEVAALATAYPDRQAWRRVHWDGQALQVPDDMVADIRTFDMQLARRVHLKEYAAHLRVLLLRGQAPVPVPGGGQGKCWVDQGTRTDLLLAVASGATVNFKLASGFVKATNVDLLAIQQAVMTFVQACFDVEAQVCADVDAGKIGSRGQVKAAAWPTAV